jgi:hypothetical protein
MTTKARYNLNLSIEVEARDDELKLLPTEEGLAKWIGDTLRIDPPLLPPDCNFTVRRVRCTTKSAAASVSPDKDRSHVLG